MTKRYEAPMFLPATAGSLLKKALQSADDMFARLHGIQGIKMVEEGGCKLTSLLSRADPWSGSVCGHQNCVPCTTSGVSKGGTCSQENILYKLSCVPCLEEGGTSACYIGESSRSAFQRGAEHARGASKGCPKNPLVKHHLDSHPDLPEPPPFKMEIMRTFRKPLERMIAEAIEIEAGKYDVTMNSKGEWGSSRLPRLTIEVCDKVSQEDFRGRNQGVRRINTVSSWDPSQY